jgi:hypothetical protein
MTTDRCVVLGDVVDSRDIADREAFERRLRAALATVNERFSTAVAEFSILKGIDEVGGVLATPADAYGVARLLHDELHPVSIRLAAVCGSVDVNPDGGDVAAMDGPAFHRADAALDGLADDDLLFRVLGTGGADALASAAGNAALTLRRGWTDRQRETVRAYERAGSQTAAADELGVGQPAVSNTLRRVHWRRVHWIEAAIEAALADGGDAP